LSIEPNDASPLGYSRSKWVAEQICASAQDEGETSHAPGQWAAAACESMPIIIIRVGQLCGNKRGVWNKTEAYPLMLSSTSITGYLPALEEPLGWLPVDQAASSILEICTGERPHCEGPQLPVYHVLNRHRTPMWLDVMPRVVREPFSDDVDQKKRVALEEIEIVSPAEWLRRLEAALVTADHPARSLLPLWRSTYSQDLPEAPGFGTSNAEAISATMRGVVPLREDAVARMWRWIHKSD